MPDLIAEDESNPREHRSVFQNLLDETDGPVRIASAYVTDADLLMGAKNRKIQLLTSLSRMDIISGATSLDSLLSLVKGGVQCRCVTEGPRVHAKVYIFGDQGAVVTSANLTRNALNTNIEVGVKLAGSCDGRKSRGPTEQVRATGLPVYPGRHRRCRHST